MKLSNIHIPTVGQHSPWGAIQNVNKIADGIYQVYTAGHGGIFIDFNRVCEYKRKVGEYPFSPWLKSHNWYEEDVDCAMIMAFWPEYFSNGISSEAIKMVKEYTSCGTDKFYFANSLRVYLENK